MYLTNKPYFMTNKDWYYFDREEFCVKLTDKAPKKAREEYIKFQELSEGKVGKG